MLRWLSTGHGIATRVGRYRSTIQKVSTGHGAQRNQIPAARTGHVCVSSLISQRFGGHVTWSSTLLLPWESNNVASRDNNVASSDRPRPPPFGEIKDKTSQPVYRVCQERVLLRLISQSTLSGNEPLPSLCGGTSTSHLYAGTGHCIAAYAL